jgi:transketolase
MRDRREEWAKKSRVSILNMTHSAKSAHVGSSLGVVDLAVQLFSCVLDQKVARAEPDVVLISKGHAAAGIYAVLANLGFIPKSWLADYGKNGAKLGGHISSHNTPMLELSTGSLGHALPFAIGRALSFRNLGANRKVYVVLSDGECDEGSNWEAALLASHLSLTNLIVVIDRNGLQSLESTESTLTLEPLDKKWDAFGWHARIIDGHNFSDLDLMTKNCPINCTRPHIFIALTTKGKGVSFMENSVLWHYKHPSDIELINAVTELESR